MESRKAARVTKDKAIRFSTSTLLTVLVGEESDQERFSIHEGIICARSEFFRRAMNGSWVEREERLVKLPKDDPEIFAIYVNLMYTNNVATNHSEEPKTCELMMTEYINLCSLYILAEKLCDIGAKNATVEAILAVSKDQASDGKHYAPGPEAIGVLYTGTPKDSLGRRLMADMCTSIPCGFLTLSAEFLPKDFFVDLAVALRKAKLSLGQCVAKQNGVGAYLEKLD